MKKRILSMLLAFVMCLGMLPAQVFAAQDDSVTVTLDPESKIFSKAETSALAEGLLTLDDTGKVALKATNEVEWIDRLDLTGADYALEFYDYLVENSGEGDDLRSADVSEYTAATFTGKGEFTYTGDKAVDSEAALAAISADLAANWNEASACLSAVYYAFDRDHPEVFWLSGESMLRRYEGYSYSSDGTVTYEQTICFVLRDEEDGFDIRAERYMDTDELEAAAMEAQFVTAALVEEAAAVWGAWNAYGMVYEFHNYLTYNNCYNSSVDLSTIDHTCREYISALFGRNGETGPVCEGYARAFKVLCDAAGIPCVLVDGYASPDGTHGEPHMWNYVQMSDGLWYAVDVTWDDPVVPGSDDVRSRAENHEYFLVGTECFVDGTSFAQSHPVSNSPSSSAPAFTNGPVLSADAYVPTEAELAGEVGGDISGGEPRLMAYMVGGDGAGGWVDLGYGMEDAWYFDGTYLGVEAVFCFGTEDDYIELTVDDLWVSDEKAVVLEEWRGISVCLDVFAFGDYSIYYQDTDGTVYSMPVYVYLPDVGFFSEPEMSEEAYLYQFVLTETNRTYYLVSGVGDIINVELSEDDAYLADCLEIKWQDNYASITFIEDPEYTDCYPYLYVTIDRGGDEGYGEWGLGLSVVVDDTGDTGTGCLLTFNFPADLCDVYATVANTTEPVYRSGDRVEAGTYLAYEITDIADGYRIKSVMMNGVDRTQSFVNGAYGGMATMIREDVTVDVELELIPEVLPSVDSVTLYMDPAFAELAADNVTVDDNTRFYGKAAYSDGVDYPVYYIGGVWEYSTDGTNWKQDLAWGSNRFDYWPGWTSRENFDPAAGDFFVAGSYDLRLRVMPKDLYTTGADVLSNVIHVNGGAGGEVPDVPVEPEYPSDSGVCGDDLYWHLESGVLTIYGTGAMWDCSGYTAPWNAYYPYIKEVIVEEGVTTIGPWALAYCEQMEFVSLPQSLQVIDYGAFVLCSALTEVTIPANVTLINSQAFTNCTSLSTVNFMGDAPQFNEEMYPGEDAFSNVTATVYYPGDNSTWTADVMKDYGGNLTWVAAGGPVTPLTQLPAPTDLNWGRYYYYDYENDVQVYGDYPGMMSWRSATMDFEHKVETRVYRVSEDGAGDELVWWNWWYCGYWEWNTDHDFSLHELEYLESGDYYFTAQAIGDGETTMDSEVVTSGIWTYTRPTERLSAPTGLAWDGFAATWDRVSGDAVGGYVIDIFWSADESGENLEFATGFVRYNCEGEMLSFDPTFMAMGDMGTGYYWFSVQTVSADMNTILHSEYSDLSEPVYFEFDWELDENGVLTIRGNGAVAVYWAYDPTITKVIIEEGITSIFVETFYGCENLTEVVIPGSVTQIDGWAFGYCESLETITFTGDAPVIGDYAFDNVTATCYYPADNNTWTTEVMANYGGNLTWVALGGEEPEVPELPVVALYSVPVAAPENQISTFTVSDTNQTFYVVLRDGAGTLTDVFSEYDYLDKHMRCEISADGSYAAVTVARNTLSEWYELMVGITDNNGATSYYMLMFYLENDVTGGWYGNMYWTLDKDGTLTVGGSGAMVMTWEGNTDIKKVVIEEGITSIRENAFSNCTNLTEVIIPVTVASIGRYAFQNCDGLESVAIPTSVAEIAEGAFYHCENLKDAALPACIKSIADWTFYNCTSLRDFAIPEGVTYIGEYAFAWCTSLTDMVIPDSVETMGVYAFQNCTGMKSVTLGSGLDAILAGTFYDCESLTEIVIPENITSIETWAFAWCEALESVTFEGDAPAIGDYTFYNVTATCYYPADNDTWTDEVMQNYGGTLTWVALGGEEPEAPNDLAVTDLHFLRMPGSILLEWTPPANAEEAGVEYYVVYYSTDGGKSWEYYDFPSELYINLSLPGGVYNAFKVETWLAGAEEAAAETIADLTLTITEQYLDAVDVSIVYPASADEKYTVTVTGLTPETEFTFEFGYNASIYKSGSSSDENGTAVFTLRNDSAVTKRLTNENSKYLIQELSGFYCGDSTMDYVTGTTAGYTVTTRGDWALVSDAVVGGEEPEVPNDLAVTDLHFEYLGSDSMPFLYWTAPANVEGDLRYNVYASTDGGQSWTMVSSTSQEMMSLTGLDAAVYTSFKVETELDDKVVAECTAKLTLTITQGEDLPAATVVFTAPETEGDDYDILVSGLTPRTWIRFALKRTNGSSSSGSISNASGEYRDSESWNNMSKYLADETSAYLVQEFSNPSIAEDGLSASFTVRNRGGWASIADAVVGGGEPEEPVTRLMFRHVDWDGNGLVERPEWGLSDRWDGEINSSNTVRFYLVTGDQLTPVELKDLRATGGVKLEDEEGFVNVYGSQFGQYQIIYTDADGAEYSMPVTVGLPMVGFYKDKVASEENYLWEQFTVTEGNSTFYFVPREGRLTRVELDERFAGIATAEITEDGYAVITVTAVPDGNWYHLNYDFEDAYGNSFTNWGRGLNIKSGIPHLMYRGYYWNENDELVEDQWFQSEYHASIQSGMSARFYFGTEDSFVAVDPDSLSVSGDGIYLEWVYTDDGLVDHVIIHTVDFGDYEVIYTAEDGTKYTLPVTVGLPDVGFYSESVASEKSYLYEAFTVTAENNTFYLVPINGALTNVELLDELAGIATVTMGENGSYAAITVNGTPNGRWYNLRIEFMNSYGDSRIWNVGLQLFDGNPHLMFRNLSMDESGELVENDWFRTDWNTAINSGLRARFYFGTENDFVAVDPDSLRVSGNGIVLEYVYTNDGAVDYVWVRTVAFGQYEVIYTHTDGKEYSIPVNVGLPPLGFYSQSVASEKAYLEKFTVSEENNTFYLIPQDFKLISVELNESFAKIAAVEIAEDGSYATITVTGTPNGNWYYLDAVVEEADGEHWDWGAGLQIVDGNPHLMFRGMDVDENGMWYEDPNAAMEYQWNSGIGYGRVVKFYFGTPDSYVPVDVKDLTATAGVTLTVYQEQFVMMNAVAFGKQEIVYTDANGEQYSLPVTVSLRDLAFYSKPVASEENYIDEFTVTAENNTVYLVALNGKLTKVELLLDFARIAEVEIAEDGSYAAITVTGTPDGNPYMAIASCETENGNVWSMYANLRIIDGNPRLMFRDMDRGENGWYENPDWIMRDSMVISLDSASVCKFYFGTEGNYAAVAPDSLTTSGDGIVLQWVYNNDGSVYYALVLGRAFGEYQIIYTDADGEKYTLPVKVSLPPLGFYTEPVASEAAYIEEFTVTDENDTFYLIAPDNMLTRVELSSSLAKIATVEIAEDGSYAAITVTGTPNVGWYGLTADFGNEYWSNTGIGAGLYITDGRTEEPEIDYAVTDLHFEEKNGMPYLYWTAPAGLDQDVCYAVLLSMSVGGRNQWLHLNSTGETWMDLTDAPSHSYTAVKVATKSGDSVLGETLAESVADLTLTVTEGADLEAATVVITPPETEGGDYTISISGMTPDTFVSFAMRNTDGISFSKFLSDADGAYVYSVSYEQMQAYLKDTDSVYRLKEFSGSVSEDGKNADLTGSIRGDWFSIADAVAGGVNRGALIFRAADWTPETGWFDNPDYGMMSEWNCEIKSGIIGKFFFVTDTECVELTIDQLTVSGSGVALGESFGFINMASNNDGRYTVRYTHTDGVTYNFPVNVSLPDVAFYTQPVADGDYFVNVFTVTELRQMLCLMPSNGYTLFDISVSPELAAIAQFEFNTSQNYVIMVITEVPADRWYDVEVTYGNETETYTMTVSVRLLNGIAQPDTGISGMCGDDLTWQLNSRVDESGENCYELIITGTGAMYDYSYSNMPDWSEYREQIKWIELSAGQTTVGAHAFENCYYVTELTIPDSVESVGDYAFTYMSYLEKLDLGEGLKSIGNSAFYGCDKSLTEVVIPDSVTYIGVSAFASCDVLEKVTLGSGLITIDDYAFQYDESLTEIAIPDSVTTIGYQAFDKCYGLTKVTIGSGVTSIEGRAFANCIYLTEITFTGSAPVFAYDSFVGVSATCYYPAAKEGWTSEVLANYGGTLTWKPYGHEDASQKVGIIYLDKQYDDIVLGWKAPEKPRDDLFYRVTILDQKGMIWSYLETYETQMDITYLDQGSYIVQVASCFGDAGLQAAVVETTLTVGESTSKYPAKVMIREEETNVYFSGLSSDSIVIFETEDGGQHRMVSDAKGLSVVYGWHYPSRAGMNYRVREISLGRAENGGLLVLYTTLGWTEEGEGWYCLDDALPAAVSPEAGSVETEGLEGLTEAETEALLEAAEGVTVEMVTDQLVDYAPEEDGSTVEVEVVLNVTVTGYNVLSGDDETAIVSGSKALTLDIEPVAIVTTTDAQGASSSTTQTVDTTGAYVLVKIPLPAGFAEAGDVLYVIHTKDDGSMTSHKVTVLSDENGGLYISFMNANGFSTFNVTSDVASVTDGEGNETIYSDLNAAIKAAASIENGGTVTLLVDLEVEGVVIPKGVTLNLAGFTLTADYVVGLNGSYLTATANAGKLIVEKGSLVLAEQGYKNASGQYILPIWDPEQNCYLFSLFVVNTNNAERGLFIDEENETIRFQFKHQATGAINQGLLSDGASDNALKVIVRLVWSTGDGEAYQDFVYNDNFVRRVAVGENGVSYDYSFTLTGYSAMNIQLDTLSVTAMIITDSGAVALGTEWTAEMAK